MSLPQKPTSQARYFAEPICAACPHPKVTHRGTDHDGRCIAIVRRSARGVCVCTAFRAQPVTA